MGGPNFAPNGLQKHVQKSSTPSKLNPSHVLPLPAALATNVAFALFFTALYYLFKNWDPNNTSSFSPLVELMASLSLVASCILFLAFGFFRIACFYRLFGVMYMQRSTGSKSLDDSWDVQDDERGLLVQACTTSSAPLSFAQGKRDQQMLLGLKLQDNNDDHIANAVCDGTLPSHSLEAELGDPRRAALVRKKAVELMTNTSLDALPLDGFDYGSVLGQCCEMVIGYLQIPIGVAGPLLLDGFEYMIPMATTEGCLVASTNRGCKAIHLSGGASSVLLRDGMTRAPIVRFLSAQRAAELKFYVEDANNLETLCVVFSRTSRFARLQCIQCALAGRNLYMRFVCSTGDAMGMNMVSKGVQNVLGYLQHLFPDMEEVSISGNYCADKKATAVNWIKGRGKSVVCDAVIKGEVVAKVLKTTVPALVELNMLKNLAGSAVAGALGGYNAHASNVVTAIFIATGQDPAQNVESSHCITIMEPTNNGHDLHVSVTMPSIEVGTVGGGTELASQSACLNLLGVKGPSKECPGANAQGLARIVAGAVLAGELSLLSALAAGHLVKSHMKYNRSNKNLRLDVVEGATTKGSL